MNEKGCGCGKPVTTPPLGDEYLMVKTSGRSASVCGTGEDGSTVDLSCNFQGPTYDVTTADFTIPAIGDVSPLGVCNGSAYTVAQWIQFVPNGSRLQISSIAGNYLYVRNGCANGAPVRENDDPGTVIKKGTIVNPADQPECLNNKEWLQLLQLQLNQLKYLELPLLQYNQSDTATMEVVAYKASDSVDTNFKKALYRLKYLWMLGARLFWKNAPLLEETSSQLPNYRQLFRHKTTGEIMQRLNPSERTDLQAGQKYVEMIVDGAQRLVGPAYVYKPANNEELFTFGGSATDPSTWTSIPVATPMTQTVSLSVASVVDDEILGDYFIAWVQVHLGIRQQNGINVTGMFYINDVFTARVGSQGFANGNDFMVPLKIAKDTKQFTIKYSVDQATGVTPCHCSIILKGLEI